MSQMQMYPGLMASSMAAAQKPQVPSPLPAGFQGLPGGSWGQNGFAPQSPVYSPMGGQSMPTMTAGPAIRTMPGGVPGQQPQSSQYPAQTSYPQMGGQQYQASPAIKYMPQGVPGQQSQPQQAPAPSMPSYGGAGGGPAGGIVGRGMGGSGGFYTPGQLPGGVDGNITSRLAGQPPVPPGGNPGASGAQQQYTPPQFNNMQAPPQFGAAPQQQSQAAPNPGMSGSQPPQNSFSPTAAAPQYGAGQGAASPAGAMPSPPQFNSQLPQSMSQPQDQPQPQQQANPHQLGGSFGTPQAMRILGQGGQLGPGRMPPMSNFNPTGMIGGTGSAPQAPGQPAPWQMQQGGQANAGLSPAQQAADPAFMNMVRQNYLGQMAAPGHGAGAYSTGFNP